MARQELLGAADILPNDGDEDFQAVAEADRKGAKADPGREIAMRVCDDGGIYETTAEKGLDRPARQDHVNLDSGRRGRILPRKLQPDCGCDECLRIRLEKALEQAKR